MSNKRAAVYARVSTAEQVDGTSLDSQVRSAQAYATAQGWTVAGSYIDEGVSGAKATRPALDRLLRAVRAGDVEVVIVAKLDRIGRSMRHLAALLGEMDDRAVTLVSVSEAFDSATASGRLQRNMLGSFAEFERELIRDRMHTGRDAAVRAGTYVATGVPYGYRVEGSGPGRHLSIDPTEADTLRLAIELFVDHRYSTGQVAAELNARGLRPRLAPRWNGHALRNLLRDAHGISGTWTWRHPRRGSAGPPIPMTVPAIIDDVTHDRLKARLAETTRRQSRNPERHLLGGRLSTPHGTNMYGMQNGGPRFYRCSDSFAANAPPGGRTCTCRNIRAEPAEAAVWTEVCALLADPDRLLAMSGLQLARHEHDLAAGDQDLAAIDRRIARLETAAADRLVRLLADGLDPAVANQVAKGLTDELDVARRHRNQIAAWQATNSERRSRTQQLIALAGQAADILPAADHATKRRILDLLHVQVQVQTWEPCPTCNGVGYVSKCHYDYATQSMPPNMDSHQPGFDNGCPECHRHRWLPQLLIEGTVPEAHLDARPINPSAARWPFRLLGHAG